LDCWDKILPKQFYKWNKIFYNSEVLKYWKAGYGENKKLDKGATDINLLSIDTENVPVYDYIYNELAPELKKYNVNAIPVSFRHHNIWSGGLHCATCDINRDSKMEEYF
jgi:hypothetical protein